MSGEISISITQENDLDRELSINVAQQESFKVDIEQDSTVKDLEVAFIQGVSGIPEVYHNDDFSGKGTPDQPLQISSEYDSKKQDKLTAGDNITISDENVISAKVETYVFEQGESSTIWNITHNLDKHPSVTVVDSGGTVITCRITYLDENHCRLEMNAPFKGKAYLN